MGELKDTINVIQTLVTGDEITRKQVLNAKPTSLAKMASEGTLQFPVLVSGSLDIETAQNISKALERNYTTFVQTALSLFPAMRTDVRGGVNAKTFIKQFHQNANAPGMNSFDLVANLMDEGYTPFFSNEDMVFESAIYETGTATLKASNKEQLIDLMESVRNDILNEKYVPRAEVTYNFSDKELNKKFNAHVYEDINSAKLDFDKEKFEHQKAKDEFDKEKFNYQKTKDALDRERTNINVDLLRNVLVDNDVKKANELIATTLHIRVKLFDKDGSDAGIVDFIIGVKCIMHNIKSEEMIVNLVGACTNNDRVFNFLRWTTGEISFFKDFLFNINEIKADVGKQKMGASRWWLSLKKRRLLSSTKRSLLSDNRLLPNATIVINAEEASYIKTQYGYDLFNPLFISKIMDQYYLLGFVIVDTSSQVAHFLFEDDKSNYQTVTFSALEKAGSNDERKFKEMLKAVNRF